MEKQRIIEEYAARKGVESIVRRFSLGSDQAGELSQEVYMVLLLYDGQKICAAFEKGKLDGLVFRIAKIKLNSSSNSHWRTYRKFQNLTCEYNENKRY